MRDCFSDVIAFEVAAERGVPGGRPGEEIGNEDLQLATDLIEEEWKETSEALFQAMLCLKKTGRIDDDVMLDVADGLADLIWVCNAAAVRLGIDLPAVWNEVKKSNMSKFGPGAWKDENMKVRKPPDWVPPDIAAVLVNQKPLSETYGTEK